MLSLDNRLKGDTMYIRPSMKKFDGSPSWDIEMCNANSKPLPMFLNRQYIKILEDLGVSADVFLRLQRQRVKELRMMTTSHVNASKFLEFHHIGIAAHLPYLIKLLGYIGVPLQADDFLQGVVEVAALSQLREIKYRGRILLDNGITLFGIMDETGYLKEGEIYCVFERATGGKKVLIRDRVAITRPPALHPGDIQWVRAVNVPKDSPLSALNNCICFSRHGRRDLPSQLSGGDLDGDHYNVIWDPDLLPKIVYSAADYPRVRPIDIGRPITCDDMTDFFVTFMETDQLGRISNLHMQLADRYPEGVVHKDCIKLAELASTAVDFSKTGIPVDIREIPRNDGIKPDFMAPGPRVRISESISILEKEIFDDGKKDTVDELIGNLKRGGYYESQKVLGVLFRDIDERAFLAGIHRHARAEKSSGNKRNVMERVFEYVKAQAAVFQWEHYRPFARRYRAA